jgi:hypothetical protein
MDLEALLSIITSALGLLGLIWTIVHFRRGGSEEARVREARDAAAERRRFLWTWLLLGALAFVVGASLWLTIQTAADQNDLSLAAAEDAQQTSDDTVAYLRGEQGIAGVPGANGVDGTPGLPGTGEPGEPGTPGAAGEKGAAGDPGPAGEPGAQGPTGTAGVGTTGPPGVPGEPGAQGGPGPGGEAGTAGPKGEPGANGAAGPAGPQGPAGPSGPAGPAAPAVVPTTAAGASANDPNSPKTATATCPDGKRVTGGGYALVPNDPGIILTASAPVGVTGWSATATELSLPAATNWQLLVFAVCA